MTLDAIDWRALTPTQASRLIPAADRAERAAGARLNASDDAGLYAAHAAWLAAFTIWENLRVFALTGERPCEESRP